MFKILAHLFRRLNPRHRTLTILGLIAALLILLSLPRRPKVTLPPAEAGFVTAATQARESWVGAPNDLARVGMRQARAAALCKALPGMNAVNWTGWIQTIEPNTLPDLSGKASARIVIALTDHLTVSTPASPLLNMPGTMVEAGSPIYAAARTLPLGAEVKFSGRFVASRSDCMDEESFTVNGSMRNPDFKIVLTALRAT